MKINLQGPGFSDVVLNIETDFSSPTPQATSLWTTNKVEIKGTDV